MPNKPNNMALSGTLLAVLTVTGGWLAPGAAASVDPLVGLVADPGTACSALGTPDFQPGEEQDVLSEGPWTLAATLDAAGRTLRSASKALTVAFTAKTEQRAGAAPGEATSDIQDCSAGACSVLVTVYAKSTTDVRHGEGYLGFLPFFYVFGSRTTVAQEVSATTFSKIHCDGLQWTALTYSGGVGPQTAWASMHRTNAESKASSCSYLNVPAVQESCTILFGGPNADDATFHLDAKTDGVYTRFDVVNGGGQAVGPSLSGLVAGAPGAVCLSGATVDLETLPVHEEVKPICLGKSGAWQVQFSSIAINVDTQKAKDMLGLGS